MAAWNELRAARLEDFRTWLVDDGFTLVPTQGVREALRATKASHKYPLIVYRRQAFKHGKPYMRYSVSNYGGPILGAYLRDRRMAAAQTRRAAS